MGSQSASAASAGWQLLGHFGSEITWPVPLILLLISPLLLLLLLIPGSCWPVVVFVAIHGWSGPWPAFFCCTNYWYVLN